ncbi:ras guanine nucleotide exchange factor G-like [Drosophila ficusphila]|uniref:ras guanine nucleotide exchange factor G-like n=1 Tax=Drosophila ficusphila TaxID=30025 RepID=UPI001C897931|nr:ras guanine nucleotide exchange factor G-like [Drosophila ficusphila]
MFLKPKSFEQSLRGGIVPAVPAAPGSGLNPSFHKGCTGKAHACGTNKSQRTGGGGGGSGTAATGGSKAGRQTPKAQRKNSISSETISESGSENSNSWPSSSSAAVPSTAPPPKPPRLAATKAKEAAALAGSPPQPPVTPIFERSTKRSLSFRSSNSKNAEAKASPGETPPSVHLGTFPP